MRSPDPISSPTSGGERAPTAPPGEGPAAPWEHVGERRWVRLGRPLSRQRQARRPRLLSWTLAFSGVTVMAAACGMTGSPEPDWGPEVTIGQEVAATVDNVWMGDNERWSAQEEASGCYLNNTCDYSPTFASNGVYGLGTAHFGVSVDSIRCNGEDCEVSLRVRNDEAVPAQYSCEGTTATGSAGSEYTAMTVGLGNNVAGCNAVEMHLPGAWEPVPVRLFHVNGETLTSLQIPGTFATIELPAGVH